MTVFRQNPPQDPAFSGAEGCEAGERCGVRRKREGRELETRVLLVGCEVLRMLSLKGCRGMLLLYEVDELLF